MELDCYANNNFDDELHEEIKEKLRKGLKARLSVESRERYEKVTMAK